MTVRELLERISSKELSEWQAFYDIEPWGEERADLRAGMIAAPLLNAWRGKNSRAHRPSEWLMKFGEQEQDWTQMKALLKGLSAVKFPERKSPPKVERNKGRKAYKVKE